MNLVATSTASAAAANTAKPTMESPTHTWLRQALRIQRCTARPLFKRPAWPRRVGAFGAFLALKLSRSQRLWQNTLGDTTPRRTLRAVHNKNPAKDFCWWDLGGVWCLVSGVWWCLCSGRWLVGPFRTSNKLFYLTRPQLALLKSLPYNDR